ncbi:ISC system 2Fe-2S type ferredoxin [Leeia sp. TBRC 13508]|uniref:2Fe-2S ferredoxin n=1 Tax=Leeia speluncae TaxID=2884804 RepID=A0ABS8D4T3_9NEIS|nr:ISC system 2Fe-2S type ferredoxin [Leeia speluncae]MCB6183202.1 ISC system 2Fe-2S type ferredoxin [Leeia speluncae]
MTKIVILPHDEICPNGAEVEATPGQSICDALLEHDIDIDHACGQVCACTTCHVIIREGFASLNDTSEDEDDMLDRAWGLTAQSRLGCQAKVANTPLVVEIPKYSLNHAKEGH